MRLSSSSSASVAQPLIAEQRSEIIRKFCSRCKYCTVVEHFAKDCTVPYYLCHWIGGDRCSVPKAHSYYCPLTRPIFPYVEFHSIALISQLRLYMHKDDQNETKMGPVIHISPVRSLGLNPTSLVHRWSRPILQFGGITEPNSDAELSRHCRSH